MRKFLSPGGLPVFWQTLGLVLFTLVIVQALAVAMSFLLPPPRPDFSRLSDVATVLAGGSESREEGSQRLDIRLATALPAAPDGLVYDPALSLRLAERLGLRGDQVRLYGEPDRGRGFPFRRRGPGGRAREQWRDPILFGGVLAAAHGPAGWRVAASPPPPFLSAWQRRLLLWFALAALALVPLAWAFARAIGRQLGRFAEAADRLGADPQAPRVEERGAAELRVAARALNRMQARIADHLAERTGMIGAIAHDLRTPLARIAFRAEAAPEALRERILADVSQMRAMIAATIGFVRSTGGAGRERVPVDLAGLLRALADQERDLDRPVTLDGAEPVTVAGDPLALERLLQNLIDNGVTYGERVVLSLAGEGREAVLTVADAGPGLPPELLERVFQPFARGDPSRNRATGGIGLGLTIARTIAEDHGGTLHLVNRAGGGLGAVLRLPVAD